MGYTHYFTAEKAPTLKQWSDFIKGAKQLIAYVKKQHIVDLDSEVSGFYIDVNGVGGESCENLYLKATDSEGFDFCKTNRYAYDVVVVALLCLYEECCPGCRRISSDGWRHEWEDGHRLATIALGREIPIPNSVEAKPIPWTQPLIGEYHEI